ncbi:unnamed protein product [Didymodactylos carnosus]|uniref:Uncharacterized protein n=1 Tax=Didymodactylos carnosus TaxID=1234261 RepID=A0A815R040_9BILA|nr:unnamed protein product [Didymodactylos carnosus]CAF1470082.1 unnamed protein product [Didymodactylos carnosus]CAF3815107.1 unnamed protein product [Didymodactylos carnosus]CAF4338103.1 unnamed protein product [Didymodactylos carnosus]
MLVAVDTSSCSITKNTNNQQQQQLPDENHNQRRRKGGYAGETYASTVRRHLTYASMAHRLESVKKPTLKSISSSATVKSKQI